MKSKFVVHGPTGIAGAGVLNPLNDEDEEDKIQVIPAPPVLLTQKQVEQREQRLLLNKQNNRFSQN